MISQTVDEDDEEGVHARFVTFDRLHLLAWKQRNSILMTKRSTDSESETESEKAVTRTAQRFLEKLSSMLEKRSPASISHTR